MLPKISFDGVALRTVPVSICSPSFDSRSITISAPVVVEDKSSQASQIASIAIFHFCAKASPVSAVSEENIGSFETLE